MNTSTTPSDASSTRLRHGIGLAVATMAGAVLVPAALSSPASAHGWITSPPSRQDSCASGATSFDCGPISYEPQSVEAPQGATSCSGGSQYAILDDSSLPWPVTDVGQTVTLQWRLTAAHRTSTWEYFVDGELHETVDQGNTQPPSDVSHTISGLTPGRHTILARWNVADTVNAFYSCVDVNVGTGVGNGLEND
ncbi:lytic polysaccharide monooxygenase auxiliary activity family 9 protein [Nocardioides hwasunensis]|uniref:Lytic polysaccharide monooxygenase n=1 Tax=Nocardioides hwasunensis TaxID=397258 RepID=A0ABR8MGM8_9ACTN|nr:lytic polysaccharide monooxygenase auxiliary activity family 9 protein [Nocardioides hwasunensis]MBD3914416.1 lytic polysaccharide monooxygenase [Nocardioides hwasunensis]